MDTAQRANDYNEAVILAGSVSPERLNDDVTDQVRISGDLRFELETLRNEASLDELQASINAASMFAFVADAAKNPFDNPSSETDSGTSGVDPGSSLESSLSEDAFDFFMENL